MEDKFVILNEIFGCPAPLASKGQRLNTSPFSIALGVFLMGIAAVIVIVIIKDKMDNQTPDHQIKDKEVN